MQKLVLIVLALLIVIGLLALKTPAWPFGIFLLVVATLIVVAVVWFALHVLNATHG